MIMTDIETNNTAEYAEIIDTTSAEVVKETVETTTEEKESIKFSKFEIKMLFNPALDGVKLTDIEKEDRIKLIKLKIQLGKIAKELEEYDKAVVESFKDSEYTSLEEKANSTDATEEIKKEFEELQQKINTKINETCVEEYNKEIDIESEHISEDTFFKAISTVDLVGLGGYEYLYNKLVKK